VGEQEIKVTTPKTKKEHCKIQNIHYIVLTMTTTASTLLNMFTKYYSECTTASAVALYYLCQCFLLGMGVVMHG
jgi:hypothetical protein